MVSFVDTENKAIDKETIILCSVDQSPSKGQVNIKTIWISWPMQEMNETYLFLKISSFAHWQTQDIRVYLWCHFCGCCKAFNRVVSLFVANNRCVFFFKFWQTWTLESESDHVTHEWFSEQVYLYWARVIQVLHPDPRLCVKSWLFVLTVFEWKKKQTRLTTTNSGN